MDRLNELYNRLLAYSRVTTFILSRESCMQKRAGMLSEKDLFAIVINWQKSTGKSPRYSLSWSFANDAIPFPPLYFLLDLLVKNVVILKVGRRQVWLAYA